MENHKIVNEVLVQLYQGARTRPLGQFQEWALERIARRVPFTLGAWGSASDEGCELAQPLPGLQAGSDAATAPHMLRDGTEGELLCACLRQGGTQALYFNLFRPAPERFETAEIEFINALLPHLAEALTIHRRLRVVELEARGEVVALVDRRGQVQAAALGFEMLLREEWPGFDSRLPASVVGREREPAPYSGKAIHLVFEAVGAEFLIRARQSTPMDALTRREQAIAEYFTKGLSYKAVANKLGISPATVRNHLSRIYGKLGVHDKGELATLFYTRPFAPQVKGSFPRPLLS